MKTLILPLTIGLVGATGCTTLPQVAQRDYAQAVVGSWTYTLTHRGDTYLTCIIVFHADGRWGVRYPGDPSKLEDIRGRRWRIEGDKLFKTGPDDDLRLGPELRRLAGTPDTIVAFTADKFVTSDVTTGTYTRIQKPRKMPNYAMERTPNRAYGKQCDIDGQPEGGLAGKPGIKTFGVANLFSLDDPARTP